MLSAHKTARSAQVSLGPGWFSAQHGDLVTEHQDLHILGCVSPKLRAYDAVNPLLSRGFALWGFVVCLLEGEWDGGVEELEGAALGVGGDGEGGHDGAGVGVAQVVAGQGGQVGEQAAVVCPEFSG